MRLLIDENCAERELVKRLREAGHDIETTIEALGPAASDDSIFAFATSEERAIVTKDATDFRRLFGEAAAHFGLLVVYADRDHPKRSAAALARAIDTFAATYPGVESFSASLNEFMW